jgi:oligosaccharide repeat unit polymerase
MIVVSIVSFCVAFLLVLETLIRKSDFFSPARIYLFFHSLTLGISFLALDPAMTPFHPFTSFIYFGSGACFLLGTGIIYWLGKSQKAIQGTLDFKRYNWRVHWVFAFFLFFVFVWGMLKAYRGAGEFPLLAKENLRAIHTFFTVSWSSSAALSFGGMVMVLFFLSIFRPRRLPKILNLGLWMTIVSVLIFALALSRSGLVFFAFFAIVFYHQAIRRISIWKMSVLFLVFFTIFLGSAFLKFSTVGKKEGLKVKPEEAVQILLRVPYVYVANNFWNLDYALNPTNLKERHPTTYGYTTLSGILDLMALPGGNLGITIRESYHFDDQFMESATKVKGLNTMGYQWGLYKDFGIAGVLLCPFLFGIFFGAVYLNVRRQPTILNLSMYSYLAFFVGWSWFLAMWESTNYIYGLFYVFLCCYFSSIIGSERLSLVRSSRLMGTESDELRIPT